MNTLAFLQNINGPEILLIFLIVLLLFGAKRLPELFSSFGKSIREFKKATSDIEDDIRTAMEEKPEKPKSSPAPKQVESETTPEPEPVNSEPQTEAEPEPEPTQPAEKPEKTDKA